MNIIKSLFKKSSSPEIKIGDKFIDKIWGDTTIEIIAISTDKKELRYKFLKIDGNVIINPSTCNTAKWFILERYTKVKNE